jgi:hypothetical protein
VLIVSAFLAVSAASVSAQAADADAAESSVMPVGAGPAATPAARPLPADAKPSRWYGWQTLAVDGASVALRGSAISLTRQSEVSPWTVVGWAGVGSFAFGAPILHLVHANPGRALASFGLRVGAPLVLGLTATAADCIHQPREGCGGATAGLIGATVGIVAAMTVDAAVFAYDQPPKGSASLPRLQIGVGPQGVIAAGTF